MWALANRTIPGECGARVSPRLPQNGMQHLVTNDRADKRQVTSLHDSITIMIILAANLAFRRHAQLVSSRRVPVHFANVTRLPSARLGHGPPLSVREWWRLPAALEPAMTFGFYQRPTATDPMGHYFYNGTPTEIRTGRHPDVRSDARPTMQITSRTGWDSNPRYRFRHAGFRDRFLQPLGHPS